MYSAQFTAINAATATATSKQFDIEQAKKVTFQFTRANHSAGSSAFTVEVSMDDMETADASSTWVVFNQLISNVTNTNEQDLTRVGTVTLSSNTTEIVAADLAHFNFVKMRVKVAETTDGTHTAKVAVEYAD